MTSVRFNKYYPIAFLYFFLNGFLLPLGLLYTALLTPLLLIWLYRYPVFKYILFFFIGLTPFAIAHLLNGVDLQYYIKSVLLLFSVYVFGLAFYQFLTECKTIRIIYKHILIVNIFLVAFAIVALSIPSLKPLFWNTNDITADVKGLRLKLLTYEPSYYATLFIPLALYYYLKLIVLKLPNPIIFFLLVTIPFLMALSFGGIFGLLFALMFTLLWGYNYFFDSRRTFYIILAGMLLTVALVVALIVFDDNIFVVRIANVLAGKDTSFRGRTSDSFYLGWEIASWKSIFFGVGPGQVKVMSLELFKKYYNNPFYQAQNVAIPNSVGDTLATLGIAGVTLRLCLEIYFFFKTRVYSNYYRLSLFVFIFIYQFTGSFISNIAEYVIWILAFHPGIFKEFDRTSFYLRITGRKNLIKQ